MRHERLALGRVLTPTRVRWESASACISCGLDAEGCTLTTWKWDAPGDVVPMCFWCLDLWEIRGWLRTA